MTIYRVWYTKDTPVIYTMLEDAKRVADEIFRKTGVVVAITTS
jgi:hypothetical protein